MERLDPKWVPQLEEALAGPGMGLHSLPDVLSAIERGEAQLWQTDDAVLVTEIDLTPKARVLNIWLAAGTMDAVLDLTEQVEGWARDQHQCTVATIHGRKGWERVGRPRGWDPAYITLHKRL